jgi:integrase
MASINRHPRSKFWVATFRDKAGKQVARSTKIEISPLPAPGESPAETRRRKAENERLARSLAAEFEAAARGDTTEAAIRKTLQDLHARARPGNKIRFETTDDFFNRWLTRSKESLKPGTFARYDKAARSFLESLGPRRDVQLSEIEARDIEAFILTRLKDGLSPSTVKVDLRAINRPFALALKQGSILTNPVPGADIPKAAGQSREPFTDEEIEALLKVAAGEWKTALLFGAFAGLRLGDAVSVRWSNIDFARRLLTVRPEKSSRLGKELILPLHPRIEKHLLKLNPPDDAGDGFLCPNLSGVKPGGRQGLSLQFRRLVDAAGIEGRTKEAAAGKGRSFYSKTFHALRHSFVSRLEAAGVPPDLRMKLAGHSDTKSHGIYSHTEAATLRKALESLK